MAVLNLERGVGTSLASGRHSGMLNELLALLVAVWLVVLDWRRIAWLAELSRSDGIYSFSPLVPVFSALIVFLKRTRLRELPRTPSSAGVLLFAAAASVTVLLDRSGWPLLSATPLLIATSVAGIIWATYGSEVLREVAFPIGFLLLLVPVPPPLVRMADYPLQKLCADVAACLAHLSRIDARQIGVVLYLRGATIRIAPPCDGLRSSVAMLTVAVAYTYLVTAPLLRKVLLVAAAIPLAYLANFLRLLCDVWVVNALGFRLLPYEADYDYVWGFLIFAVAAVLLCAMARVIGCSRFRAIS
jgi:exosortase